MQLAPAAIVEAQLVTSENAVGLAPVRTGPLSSRSAVPGLDNVTICVALFTPTVVAAKTRDDGVMTSCGAAAAVPVPARVAACVGGVALSVTVSEALKLFDEGGVNVAEMLHDAPGASVVPQPLLSAKTVGFVPVRVTLEILSVAVPGFESTTTCPLLVVVAA